MGPLSDWFAANLWFLHLIIFVVGYSLLLMAAGWIQQKSRLRYLKRRFTNPADIQRILNQIPWTGETVEQLRLSFGRRRLHPDRYSGANTLDTNTLRVLRAPKEAYIISLHEGRVSGWQLYKS